MFKPFKIRYFKDPQFNRFRFELILDNHMILLTQDANPKYLMDWLVQETDFRQQDINIIHTFLSNRRMDQDSSLEIMVEVSN